MPQTHKNISLVQCLWQARMNSFFGAHFNENILNFFSIRWFSKLLFFGSHMCSHTYPHSAKQRITNNNASSFAFVDMFVFIAQNPQKHTHINTSKLAQWIIIIMITMRKHDFSLFFHLFVFSLFLSFSIYLFLFQSSLQTCVAPWQSLAIALY